MPDYTQGDWPDATALLEQMASGARSAEAVMRWHLDRLDAVNPALNAATQVMRDAALEQAAAPKPGPLAGLPITLKETYGLAGEQVTCGSLRAAPVACTDDAPVVKKLKAAGAIVMARSNVPEFVMTAETHNLRFGRTHHPADQARTPGGSTGGEGALVASGASPLGFGTDILGSIRIPAAFCGLVGFRPHSGAIDKAGVEPVSGPFFETWNGLGPLARSVRDARLAYSVIAGQPLGPPQPLSGLRLWVPQGYPFTAGSACIDDAWQAAITGLQSAGLSLDRSPLQGATDLFMALPKLVTGEMIPLWRDWLSADTQPFSAAREVLRQVLGNPTIQPGFLLWFTLVAPLYRPRSAAALQAVVEQFETARKTVRAALGDDGLLCLPTLGMLAPKHGAMNRATLMRPGLNQQITAHTLANSMDLSAITVPAPRFRDAATGLAPGIMLAAAPGNEGRLLDAAAQLEKILARPA